MVKVPKRKRASMYLQVLFLFFLLLLLFLYLPNSDIRLPTSAPHGVSLFLHLSPQLTLQLDFTESLSPCPSSFPPFFSSHISEISLSSHLLSVWPSLFVLLSTVYPLSAPISLSLSPLVHSESLSLSLCSFPFLSIYSVPPLCFRSHSQMHLVLFFIPPPPSI